MAYLPLLYLMSFPVSRYETCGSRLYKTDRYVACLHDVTMSMFCNVMTQFAVNEGVKKNHIQYCLLLLQLDRLVWFAYCRVIIGSKFQDIRNEVIVVGFEVLTISVLVPGRMKGGLESNHVVMLILTFPCVSKNHIITKLPSAL